MKNPKKKNGDPVSKAAANMNRAELRPDALGSLSNWLRSQWLRSYVLFCAFGCERDREEMAKIGSFLDALREVRK